MVNRWVRKALLGILAGLAPAAASAQQPYYPDPVPLYRPAAGVEGAAYTGAPQGNGAMPVVVQAPVPGEPLPPGARIVDPNLLPPPRPLNGGPMPVDPQTDMSADDAKGVARWIFEGDFVMLMRARMKSEALAIKDLILVEAPDPIPPGVNGMPLFADFKDMNQNMMYGLKVGGQYLFNEHNAVELTSTIMPQHTDHITYILPGQLTSFFTSPPAVPVGFEGDNGLWDHADRMDLNLTTTMFLMELNYRGYCGAGNWEADYLLGVRWLNIHEKLAWTTDDDGIQFGPDPLTTATYTVRARNSIVAPQLGFGLHRNICPWMAVSWEGKGAWGQNFASYEIQLERGDGFSAPSGGLKKEHFCQVYESALSVDFSGTWWRLRFAYDVLFIHGVATGQNEIDFNLLNPNGNGRFDGSLLYHGPSVSFNIVF
jgi:hypothetical protein